MLDEHQRVAVLELAKKGFGSRRIARALKISRSAARDIIAGGASNAPIITRPEKAEAHREEIVELYARCKGNLVRVHEELVKSGGKLSYQALTGFCRRHELGRAPKLPAGHYDFAPGQEMQHDTSPHRAQIGGRLRSVQIASLVLCYSRMIFIQLYSCFTRFECKVFLTDALEYFGGACGRCMVDNTSVIRLSGTGKNMVPVPEMACFGERFEFAFVAHERGLRAAPPHRRRRGLRECAAESLLRSVPAHRQTARGEREQGAHRHLRRSASGRIPSASRRPL